MKSSVSVLGIGAVTPIGRELKEIGRALAEGEEMELNVRRVDESLLIDPATASALRRADRFTRMAFLAARDAWEASMQSCQGIAAERIGMILSSGFGPHCRGFKFLDGILDEGDMAASPTDFSHSVHGAASAYISRLLGIQGPALNITDFEIGFEEAIAMARCWLDEGTCDRVLVGAVEELGEVMLSCVDRMVKPEEGVRPGEGAVFLMLAKREISGVAQIGFEGDSGRLEILLVKGPTELNSRELGSKIGAGKRFCSEFGDSASAGAFCLLEALLKLD